MNFVNASSDGSRLLASRSDYHELGEHHATVLDVSAGTIVFDEQLKYPADWRLSPDGREIRPFDRSGGEGAIAVSDLAADPKSQYISREGGSLIDLEGNLLAVAGEPKTVTWLKMPVGARLLNEVLADLPPGLRVQVEANRLRYYQPQGTND